MDAEHKTTSVLSDVRDALAAPRGDAGVYARMLALDSVQRLEEQLKAVTRERDALQSAAIRLCNVHRWSYGGPETLRALADRIAESYP